MAGAGLLFSLQRPGLPKAHRRLGARLSNRKPLPSAFQSRNASDTTPPIGDDEGTRYRSRRGNPSLGAASAGDALGLPAHGFPLFFPSGLDCNPAEREWLSGQCQIAVSHRVFLVQWNCAAGRHGVPACGGRESRPWLDPQTGGQAIFESAGNCGKDCR
jgi:hypothetical protein